MDQPCKRTDKLATYLLGLQGQYRVVVYKDDNQVSPNHDVEICPFNPLRVALYVESSYIQQHQIKLVSQDGVRFSVPFQPTQNVVYLTVVEHYVLPGLQLIYNVPNQANILCWGIEKVI